LSKFLVQWARVKDAPRLDFLVDEWLNWRPRTGRVGSIKRAILNNEILVAEAGSSIIGFIHFILHEDVVDGAPNGFITAFYVQEDYRGRGIGGRLLRSAVMASVKRGATFIETSTLHSGAKAFYERHGFRQISGDIAEAFLELDVAEYLKAQ
jgi:GNAT superfamily N-acetyltransferase